MSVTGAGLVGAAGDAGVRTAWLARIAGSVGMTEAGMTEADAIEAAAIEAGSIDASAIEAGAAASAARRAGA